MFSPKRLLNCGGKLLDLSTPQLMAIVNLTPDSFYNGGKWKNDSSLLNEIELMLNEGAAIIDIGGMSTRPGAEMISAMEELNRIIPAIENICRHFPTAIVSVDTFRSEVARSAVEAGASMVNDISAGQLDETLWRTVANLKVAYVLMQMKGMPSTMQQQPMYKEVVNDVFLFLKEKLLQLNVAGIHDVIVDPGFGFGKTMQHNYQLLNHLEIFQLLGQPVLAGLSRKSMIGKVLNLEPAASLNGTTVLNTIALKNGASILRVHDVAEAKQAIKLVMEMNNSSNE